MTANLKSEIRISRFGDDYRLEAAARSHRGVALACETHDGRDPRPCVLYLAGGTVAATYDRSVGDAMANTAPAVPPVPGHELEFET